MAIPVVTNIANPFTGTFGTGQVMVFANAGVPVTWNVPPGCQAVRVRLWSGGASGPNASLSGCGGGFAMKTIYDISSVTNVVITVGRGGTFGQIYGETSSFGSFVSAVGATTSAGGYGVGGDVNYTGGIGDATNGGGAAGLFGDGGTPGSNTSIAGCAGAGLQGGFTGSFGDAGALKYYPSIDFLATGGGGDSNKNGMNGGGGTQNYSGGIPGGGGGPRGSGGRGLVVVEW